ncbi:MAG: ABC transporter ATP-binding protein [Paludibacteraceae bacterium]|nr:ABC transporter ATP-binding protein [Paludibacteraceae bacterium]MBO7259587.1 ABC transporter ATP-binding protein [Paludibacteraceae bacterium]
MNFLRLIKRFIPPYKKEVTLNIFFHLLSTLLSLVSFAAIIPILQILFGVNTDVLTYQTVDWNASVGVITSTLKNNLFYWIQQQTTTQGAGWVLFALGVFLIVTTFLKTATSYLGSYFMIPIRTGVLRDLRSSLYSKIIHLPIGFFTEERKGDVMSRMTSDVAEVEASIMASLDMMFKNPIMIIIYLTTMLLLSWHLTLFVFLLLPVSGYLIGRIGKSLKTKSMRGQEQTGELLNQIEETLGGLRVVKAFNAEKKLISRFQTQNDNTRHTFNRINRRYAMAHPVSEFLGTAVIAALLWYGGALILSNNSPITAPEFIYYLVIFYSIINPAKELSKASYSIRKGLASLERIDKILNTDLTIHEPAAPSAITDLQKEITFKHVSFAYPSGRQVLHDINLVIPKGKTVALVGQSGSGKTTMLDLLPRFYDVCEGEILIDGVNIQGFLTHDLRALMGNVNQEAILFNDSFYNNITFGVEHATMEQVQAAARIANAHDFIMATPDGYHTTIGDRGSRLSGGQRQRISIARAILKNPPILILDEATSALDTASEKQVQEALDNLMKNRTTLVVAHRLSTIKNADLICVMQDGHIVEQGTHDELYALNGYYTKLWQMQK